MKRIIVILLILSAAAYLLAAAALSSESSFSGILGQAGALVSTPGTDIKKVEDKMADALASLDSWKRSRVKVEILPSSGSSVQTELSSSPSIDSSEANSTQSNSTKSNSTEGNLVPGNSTSGHSSTIRPEENSSLDSSVDDHSANAGRVNASDANSLAGLQNLGSSSEGRFKGFYGLTASRHEISKSGINSHMFLSGNFEMDKTVKFQDLGID